MFDIFKKRHDKKGFRFVGNRPHLRTEEELLCVNKEEAAMPLYCGSKYIVISLGHRLGTYISGKDVWWDYASENIAKESFYNVSTAIGKY